MLRSPHRLLIAATLALGLAITAGLMVFDRLTLASLEREALLQQAARADHLADQLYTRLEITAQVARTMAALASPLRERSDVEDLVQGTLASTSPEYVYGIGVWFAPYALEPRSRWVGTYAHRELEDAQRIVLTYEWSSPAYDYHRQPWYVQGLQVEGHPFLSEPYFDVDLVYSSLLIPFRGEDGSPRGVVSVDVVLPQLRALVARANTSPQETFSVVTRAGRLFAHPQEASLLSWARAQGRAGEAGVLSELSLEDLRAYEEAQGLAGDRHSQLSAVPDAGWTVRVSTDKDSLFADSRRLHATLQVIGLVVWGALLAGLAAGMRTLRVRSLSRALAQQARERAALEQNERMLREVLETSMDGVAAVDAGGRLVAWNSSAERIFGWPREDILGRLAVETLCRPEDRRQRSHQLARIIATGFTSMTTCRQGSLALRRNGEVFPLEASLSTVHLDGTHRVYGFFSDVSERHRAEEERQRLLERQHDLLSQLRRRSAELRAIIDNMVEGVFVADAEGRLSFVNHAGLRMCGGDPLDAISLDGVIPRTCALRSLDGAPLERETLPMFRALRGEVVVGCDIRVLQPGGERILRMNAAPIPDEEDRVSAAVVVIHDVTEAVEFDRLKDAFVQMAAHELKTPVTVMKSFAQLALKTECGRDPTLGRLLAGIDRGANRIDQLVRTLLDVSQLHLRRMQLVEEALDLRTLVEETARRMSETRQGHLLHVHVDEAIPVWGDPARLEQVFIALLDNAMRYSPPAAPVDVVLAIDGEEVEVSIQDQGIGIPADKQPRLFNRFYRPHAGTPHDRGGMGVGLYIAREIVQQHGGQLTLESREGEGTTVRVRLPLRVAHEGTDAHPSAPGHDDAHA
ncbi:ATP-binding protein [Pyxidicoccus xibeiensis]|uniref:ATP-binding protein n=1 Tax=Pyxidicoccus xibeiensis TaxID=2906759 RepID=UPI0020A82EFB|nr:ATP-binding protein [Pyxidicoccus xibeiensis]MCP3143639.1 PAS domain S-box protein [Pyxidicoccus xibeiensis]